MQKQSNKPSRLGSGPPAKHPPTIRLSVDGKTVRGARTEERDAPHLLSCFTHHSKEVWAELAVGEKTNEIPEARKLLPTLPIKGRICTFDAFHSHRQLWNLLRVKQAYPLFVVKGNEPTLQADLTTYFADPHAHFQQAETIDHHRGRIESHLIKERGELCCYLQAEWPGISQVAQLTRTRTEKGKTSVEVVYLITILSPGQAGPHDLLALVRGHWGIENSLHYVRDVTFALRSFSHPRLPTLLSFWLPVATWLLLSFIAQDLLRLLLRVVRFLTTPAELSTCCLPEPLPSNNSQALHIYLTSAHNLPPKEASTGEREDRGTPPSPRQEAAPLAFPLSERMSVYIPLVLRSTEPYNRVARDETSRTSIIKMQAKEHTTYVFKQWAHCHRRRCRIGLWAGSQHDRDGNACPGNLAGIGRQRPEQR